MTSRPGLAKTLRAACCAAALLSAALPLSGCQTLAEEEKQSQAQLGEPEMLRNEGIKALRENRLKDASTLFNAALKLDVQNPKLQFLNGLTYHMRAVQSDRSLFPMAQQGYELAIQFDPNNWIARYHLGLLYLDQRDYERAKTTFAEALLYNDRDPDLLYNLASSAYYARDPETAGAALTRLREIEPDSSRTLRASAIVLAALGNSEQAKSFLDRYRVQESDKGAGARVARRVEDWKRVHARAQKASYRVPVPSNGADAGSGARPAQFPGFPGSTTPSIDNSTTSSTPPVSNAPAGDNSGATNAGSGETAANPIDPANRMVIVDVVIISSQEDISTAKGINLLDGLKFQFGDSSNPAFGRVTSDARSNIDGTSTSTTTITRALNIPAITYSLNIANAGATRNEVLARPTLVALAGQKSEFFSGENIKASSVSTSAQSGATDVEKDIGVKLAITPEFLDNNRIKLLVEAERTFLQTPSSSVTFDFQLRTSKTTVNANVVLQPSESLILSGLSEKETENIRDGVPGLQDLPLIQYLFSRQTTRDFNKSVLVLITPRLPEYVYRPGVANSDAASGDVVLDELKARYSDWFRPYPNWASVFRHLQNNSLYREFRTGDVALESWNTQFNRKARFKKALNFLYY